MSQDTSKKAREVTIYCDQGNRKNVVRKIGFKNEVWMDEMRTGTESTFVCKATYEELKQQAQKMREALEFYAQGGACEYPALKFNSVKDIHEMPMMILEMATKTARLALEQFDEFMKASGK